MERNPKDAALAKWMWIELIGFDNTLEDLGVSSLLGSSGTSPDVLSLHLYSAEFVHTHTDDEDELLPAECTSYYARPTAARGARQDWTRGQLRELVGRLQAHGLRVYFSFFDMHVYDVDGETRYGAWISSRPELTPVNRQGVPQEGLLNPLGHFADGTPYVEYLGGRLAQVFRFYRFDGLHGADGFTSGRLALWEADFSDAHVSHFAKQAVIDVPTGSTPQRAKWIWDHARLAWITYHVDRWNALWTTLCTVVHAAGGQVVMNNAWTRDPLEALYRYGVDYRGLVAAGVDGFILESVAAAVELLEPHPARPPLPGQLGAALLIGVTVPRTPLAALISVHDALEGWDVVRVAPALHERDVLLLGSLRTFAEGGGAAKPTIAAGVYCLSDGIPSPVWRWMDEIREGAVGRGRDLSPAGFTVVYDPAVLSRELEDLADHAEAHTHALLTEIIRAGVSVGASSALAGHQAIGTPILLLKPELYPQDLVESVLAAHPVVVTVGRGADRQWTARLWEAGSVRQSVSGPETDVRGDVAEGDGSWTIELGMRGPEQHQFVELARLAQAILGRSRGHDGFRSSGPLSERLFEGAEDTEALYWNPSPIFQTVVLTLPQDAVVERIGGVSDSPSKKRADGLHSRVPPGGVLAVRIE